MWGKDRFKEWMRNEFDMMNLVNTCKHVVRLYDAYESVNNMVLVTELYPFWCTLVKGKGWNGKRDKIG